MAHRSLLPLLQRAPCFSRPQWAPYSTSSTSSLPSFPRPYSTSSPKEPPRFDAELAAAYNRLAENHRHPAGPWPAIAGVVAARLATTTSAAILDLATGPGEPAATLATLLPTSRVMATDVSEDMVKAATAATSHLPNVTVTLADAQDLSAFPDGSVDVVTCCYGFMFPEDKPRALGEAHRVLRAGGALVTTTWDNVDLMAVSRDVMAAVLGQEPPAPALDPMALAEEGLFLRLVEEAGFTAITQTTSTYPFNLGRDKEHQLKCGTLLLRDKLEELGAWQVAEQAFWRSVGAYSRVEGNGDMVIPNNTFRLTVGEKA